jgi:hypothetical protein
MTVVEGWFGTVDLVGTKLDDGKEICHAMREMVTIYMYMCKYIYKYIQEYT